jgi:hypothetical protein
MIDRGESPRISGFRAGPDRRTVGGMTSTHFLGERYLSPATAGELVAPDPDAGVQGAARHLWTIVVAGDELCLQLYEARSRADFDALAQRTGVTFDRVSSVQLLVPAPVSGDANERPEGERP